MKPSFLVVAASVFLGMALHAQLTAPPSDPNALRDIRLIQHLQIITQQQGDIIKDGNAMLQMGTALLSEAARLALKNEQLLILLANNGYSVQPPPGAEPVNRPKVKGFQPYVPSPIPLPGAEIPDPPKDLPADVKADYEYLDGLRRKNLDQMRSVKQSLAILEPLLKDLVELAKSDPDARMLVLKHNINRDAH